jgi:hypothetical protein
MTGEPNTLFESNERLTDRQLLHDMSLQSELSGHSVLTPFQFRLIRSSAGLTAGFIPFAMPTNAAWLGNPDFPAMFTKCCLVAFVIHYFAARLIRLAAVPGGGTFYALREADSDESGRIIRFSTTASVTRAILFACAASGWLLPHVFFTLNGDTQWWNVPIGVVAIYAQIPILFYFRPLAILRGQQNLWIRFRCGVVRLDLERSCELIAFGATPFVNYTLIGGGMAVSCHGIVADVQPIESAARRWELPELLGCSRRESRWPAIFRPTAED